MPNEHAMSFPTKCACGRCAKCLCEGIDDRVKPLHDRPLESIGPTCGSTPSACRLEAAAFWIVFLRKLARLGLRGMKLVISKAGEGNQCGRLKGSDGDVAAEPGALHA